METILSVSGFSLILYHDDTPIEQKTPPSVGEFDTGQVDRLFTAYGVIRID
jgi:hypothetical protein